MTSKRSATALPRLDLNAAGCHHYSRVVIGDWGLGMGFIGIGWYGYTD